MLTDDLFGEDDQPETPATPPVDIEKFLRMYREAATALAKPREEAIRNAKYYHGPGQLDGVREKLSRNNQPAIWYNKIKTAVDDTLGILDQAETTAEAYGRNENGEDAAVIVTQVIRFQADRADLEFVKQQVSFDVLVYGIGAAIVEVADHPDNSARVSAIPFEEFFYDPCSQREDFSDASYFIRAKWMDVTKAKRQFPDHASELAASIDTSWDGYGAEDRAERLRLWIDSARRRIMVVECYYRDDQTGKWMRCIHTHNIILQHGPSGYVDDNNVDVCPIEAVAFAVDQDNARYGMVRDMAPIQHNINGRISRLTFITNNTRIRQVEQAVTVSAASARKEAASATGVVPFGYEVADMTTKFSEQMALLNNDITLLERLAPNPAMIGRAGGANTSGRAHQIMAQAGQSSLSRVFLRYEGWEKRMYRQLWWRARQFFGEAELIAITDDVGARQHMMINEPIPGPVHVPVTGPDGQPVVDPRTGQPQTQVQIGTVGYKNAIADVRMNITIDVVRNAVTLRQESFDSLGELLAKFGIPITDPSVEFLIELSPIPDKQALLAKWRSIKARAAQEQAAAQAPAQQQAQLQAQMQAALTASKTNQHNAQAEKDQAMAEKHAMETRLIAPDAAIKAAMLAQAGAPSPGLLNAIQGGTPN